MATVQAFLNECRYDTRDFTKHDYDDTQWVVYLNRATRLLADELSRRRSSDVFTVQALTQTSGNLYIDVSSYSVITCREIWRDENFVYKKPLEWIMRQRQLLDSSQSPSGTPLNWAWDDYNQYIAFDYKPSSNTSFQAHWDVYPTALTIGGNMPFNDKYNNFLREALLLLSKKSKKGSIDQTDAAMQELYRSKLQREVISKRIRQKRYYLDF